MFKKHFTNGMVLTNQAKIGLTMKAGMNYLNGGKI